MVQIDCTGKTTTEINKAIAAGLAKDGNVVVKNPASRHNLGVGINHPGKVVFEGNVGYYCAGMLKDADVEIKGNCGWSVGEDMMSGSIVVHGNASAAAGAAIRGGLLVVHGNAGPRTGISMKGGTIIIGGNVDYMSGFIMQKGTFIICGNTGEALADSMYEGRVFVRGTIAEHGNDAVETEMTKEDKAMLKDLLTKYKVAGIPKPESFKKIVSGKKLYNFSMKDYELWRVAL
ncbi:MAG: glutamate synthase [SAR202 cluster bacterium]|nr:glutamate synthase [SAR202 cluster bacterium]